jgi:hypothetical protein
MPEAVVHSTSSEERGMGFWMARARTYVGLGLVAALAIVGSRSAASAVAVSLPGNAVISMAGQTTTVAMTIGTVSNLEAVAVSVTYTESIVDVLNTTDVQRGALVNGCNNPVVNIMVPGRVTITMACTTPVSGSGTLFNITFTGIANGVSPLAFSATSEVPNGCQLNEGNPTCESSDGQITVGPVQATATATSTVASTGTATASVASTATRTASVTATATATATNTTLAATATNTATRTSTPTVTDTPTAGPSPTATQTRTVSSTATVTQTASASATPSLTGTPTNTFTQAPTATVTETRTVTATATATAVPTPGITSGAVGGSTRVFGRGAINLAFGGIEIVAVNGGQVIGTGGTNGSGSFFDGTIGIGLTRPLEAGEQIFPRDTVNGIDGRTITVGPQPPTAIPTLNAYGMAALGTLLGLALLTRLTVALQRRR